MNPWDRGVTSLVDNIIRLLDSKFSTKDPRVLSFFYGVEVFATSTSLPLPQHKYGIDLLSKHNMLDSKPISSPLALGISLTANDGPAPVNVTLYCQVVGSL